MSDDSEKRNVSMMLKHTIGGKIYIKETSDLRHMRMLMISIKYDHKSLSPLIELKVLLLSRSVNNEECINRVQCGNFFYVFEGSI